MKGHLIECEMNVKIQFKMNKNFTEINKFEKFPWCPLNLYMFKGKMFTNFATCTSKFKIWRTTEGNLRI